MADNQGTCISVDCSGEGSIEKETLAKTTKGTLISW